MYETNFATKVSWWYFVLQVFWLKLLIHCSVVVKIVVLLLKGIMIQRSVNNIKHIEVCSFILNTDPYDVHWIKPLYIIISVLLMRYILLLVLVKSAFESLIN